MKTRTKTLQSTIPVVQSTAYTPPITYSLFSLRNELKQLHLHKQYWHTASLKYHGDLAVLILYGQKFV